MLKYRSCKFLRGLMNWVSLFQTTHSEVPILIDFQELMNNYHLTKKDIFLRSYTVWYHKIIA